jgi:hypothetical protein
VVCALAALAACGSGPRAACAAIDVALAPADTVVSPGDTLTLSLVVTVAGSAFNGFDAVIGHDPAALAPAPLVPASIQQGCLMTGACSGACGQTFHRFEVAGDSLACASILLCDQTALTGPGPLYRLRFVASSSPQVTDVVVRAARFYAAGLLVGPVLTHGTRVGIGMPVGVGGGTGPGRGPALSVLPNPSRGSVRLEATSDREGMRTLDVLDVAGRRVRSLEHGHATAGSRVVMWDGAGEDGRPVPAGIYLVRFAAPGGVTTRRVARLP